MKSDSHFRKNAIFSQKNCADQDLDRNFLLDSQISI